MALGLQVAQAQVVVTEALAGSVVVSFEVQPDIEENVLSLSLAEWMVDKLIDRKVILHPVLLGNYTLVSAELPYQEVKDKFNTAYAAAMGVGFALIVGIMIGVCIGVFRYRKSQTIQKLKHESHLMLLENTEHLALKGRGDSHEDDLHLDMELDLNRPRTDSEWQDHFKKDTDEQLLLANEPHKTEEDIYLGRFVYELNLYQQEQEEEDRQREDYEAKQALKAFDEADTGTTTSEALSVLTSQSPIGSKSPRLKQRPLRCRNGLKIPGQRGPLDPPLVDLDSSDAVLPSVEENSSHPEPSLNSGE
eukprot:CAMPEP_0196581962 /NCGR_PEP_ID=MMETSP1081-20130531/36683_1 /TAXON_ID=36882 /ORGANISM="Pyramimonas amylifera, Strain CCMP720" /LENGTH=304 /DNA_ID=CAMNT_0041902391 /DNA_START=282 /DNA_END=1196 /DNA_ORIENTATION=+